MDPVPHPAMKPAVAPPSGRVTFLFSDIEGSTQRWERDHVAMQAALRRHDEIVRAAIAGCGGFVFKTIGDAFCAAFASAADAAAAALDAQRRLGTEDFSAVGGLRVRMALHSGSADERDGDYFGPTLNRVARLLATAYGGQVILSQACADILAQTPSAEGTLADLGYHRLKDLTKPERVYQLTAPGLPADFPKLRSLNVLSNNFPVQAGPLIGRAREVAEIGALLAHHRMVTLAGAGGIGKTRASLQVGVETLERWADGAWLVELAPLSEGELIPGSIAADLGVQLSGEGDALRELSASLRAKHLLLILDNCEHLVAAVAQVASTLLRTCPNLHVLASSRQALAIAGETIYRIPSLSLPAPTEVPGLDAACAAEYGAIELFVARARAADAAFRLRDDNAPAIARVCRRLDGIALAIELAAARVRTLSPSQLHARLDQRLRLLTGGRRDAMPRQQTLRAAIDWSYDLLGERERSVLCAAGIFANGFTLEALEAVASGEDLDESEVFDALESLVDKSLVTADAGEERKRFHLLETVREYALEKLTSGGKREAVAARHLAHFQRLADRTELDHRRTGSDASFMSVLAPELDDLRAAMNWSLAGGDVRLGAALAAAVGHPWSRLGLGTEGIARLERFAASIGEHDAALLARVLAALAWLAANGFRPVEAFDAAVRAIALARAAGSAETLVTALSYYAYASARLGRFAEASSALDEAEALAGATPALGRRLDQLELRAYVSQQSGEFDAAIRAWRDHRELLRASGNEYNEANATLNIAEVEHALGNTAEAIDLARDLIPRASQLIGREQHANLLANLSGYLLALDDVPSARAAALESIGLLAGADAESVVLSIALEHFALAVARQGQSERAARLQGYSDAAFGRAGYRREHTEALTHRSLTALLEERLSAGERDRHAARGAALTPHQAIDEARSAPLAQNSDIGSLP
jgi:predicted ATPase/class 3 adenylate cyclase